uniref:Doublecortin domain-containing protein n=1 Tax=Panagrolaimus sp. ES5 TaxID=591445 RepID=A0AC34G1M0_9BILA
SSSSRMGSTPAQTPNNLGLTNQSILNNPEIIGTIDGVGGVRNNLNPINNPLFIPNIPQPVNGMIKTYDTAHRSFTRPYSAKTVFFYREGDNYFSGVRVPISKSRYRNMDSLLDDLNSNIPLPFGVRRLHTPYGRTPITSIEQLQHLGK